MRSRSTALAAGKGGWYGMHGRAVREERADGVGGTGGQICGNLARHETRLS